MTAYVQVVAPDVASAAAGDAMVVVNRVFEGVGWLTARHASGSHPDHRRLCARLQGWLAESVAPREPVDLMIGGECNDLQAHTRLTSRVFAWPGEPLLRERTGILRPESVALHHNATTGFLELTEGDERPVALVYLGSILPSPAWGISYGLTVLAQPHCHRASDFSPPARPSTEVFHSAQDRGGVARGGRFRRAG